MTRRQLLQEYLRFRCWAERMDEQGQLDMAADLRACALTFMNRLAELCAQHEAA
jgi:hypothetical protein